MSLRDGDGRNCFTVIWKIENMSYCWQRTYEDILSPTFVVDTMEATKWNLWLNPRNGEDGNSIGCYLYRDINCIGVDTIDVDYELSFLAADGSVLNTKNGNKIAMITAYRSGFPKFEFRKDVFISRRSSFLPEDTLTIRCRMRRSDCEAIGSGECFVRTRIQKETRSFQWNIEGFSTIKDNQAVTYTINSSMTNQPLMNVDLFLTTNQSLDEVISFLFTTQYGEKKMSTIQISVLGKEGEKMECLKEDIWFHGLSTNYMQLRSHITKDSLIAAKSEYLPGDVLSLLCVCTFSTGVMQEEIEYIHYGEAGLRIQQPFAKHADDAGLRIEQPVADAGESSDLSTRVLKENMKSLCDDGLLSDVQLRTDTGTFPAHRSILGARSPVFAAMFSSDMKESACSSVHIRDLDDETVRRMLRYLYTADVDELDWEGARRLYEAGDKYQVLSLKDRCSRHLRADLRPANSCEALGLADLHHDANLKRFVQDFILEHPSEVLKSNEWACLMEANPKLAAETMYLKF